MPELPDVEGYRRMLEGHATGKRISAVEVRDPGVVRGRSSADFVEHLEGRRFAGAERRGKWLVAHTDGPTLLLHFGMTGSLLWELPGAEPRPFERVSMHVGRGQLVYRDQRKLRGLWLVDDEDGIEGVIGEQGPDALGLTDRELAGRLDSRRGPLKTVLMDQRVVAGLGNMLSDEVLWGAGIHPARRWGDLSPREQHDLARRLQRVIRASVKVGQIPRRPTWLSSQRSRAKPCCPRCGEPLQTSRLGGRTSYWCPVCQSVPS